jgi:hypothetical protein
MRDARVRADLERQVLALGFSREQVRGTKFEPALFPGDGRLLLLVQLQALAFFPFIALTIIFLTLLIFLSVSG